MTFDLGPDPSESVARAQAQTHPTRLRAGGHAPAGQFRQSPLMDMTPEEAAAFLASDALDDATTTDTDDERLAAKLKAAPQEMEPDSSSPDADYSQTPAEDTRTTASRPSAVDRAIVDISHITADQVSWLWPSRIPFGKLTILDGDPGLGKSTLLLDLAARLTTARPMPDEPISSAASSRSSRVPASVMLLSAEDTLADTIRPRLEAAGADLTRVVVVPYLPTASGQELLSIPRDLPDLTRLARRTSARLLLIDPLLAFLHPRVNPHSDQAIRRNLAPLNLAAQAFGLAVVLVRHLTKQASGNPLYRGGGSIGLLGSARSGLLVARDPEDPSGGRCLLLSTKSNLGPPPPALAYRLVTAPNGASCVRWEGVSPHTASSVLSSAAQDPARRDALAEAQTVLSSILSDGPVPADELRRLASRAGIGPSLLWRAKLALGIRSRKIGTGRAPGGQHWLWTLPAQASGTEAEDPHAPYSKIFES